MNLDRTFCASPNCANECGRKITPQEQAVAMEYGKPLSWGYFCGNPVVFSKVESTQIAAMAYAENA